MILLAEALISMINIRNHHEEFTYFVILVYTPPAG